MADPDEEALGAAVTASLSAVASAPIGHPDYSDALSKLAVSLFNRWAQLGHNADLDAAEIAWREAIATTSVDQPDHAKHLSNLGLLLRSRVRYADGSVANLDEAIEVGRRAVAATPPSHHSYANYQSSLGSSLYARYELARGSADLADAVIAFRQAVAATPAIHNERANNLWNLAAASHQWFNQTGDITDLDEALMAGQQALSLTVPGTPDYAYRAYRVGAYLVARFVLTGDQAHLDDAIEVLHQAISSARPDDLNLPAMLSDLSAAFHTRFRQKGVGADIEASIDAGRRAIAIAQDADPGLGGYLSNLATSHLTRYQWLGNDADLEAALRVGRQAVSCTPPGHPDFPGILMNLGNILQSQFGQDGDDAVLDEAIDTVLAAVAMAPPGHPARTVILASLGNFLLHRFERTGDGADLEDAIQAHEEAIALTPPAHPDLPTMLTSVIPCYVRRFERTGGDADLDEAINAARAVVAMIPPGHKDRATSLTGLGNCLQRRFGRSGEATDLDDAIYAHEEAIASLSANHPDLALCAAGLGMALYQRSERAGDGADLDAAILAGQQAAAAFPPGHPELAAVLSNLGTWLYQRFTRAGDGVDRDGAIASWRRARRIPGAAPAVRIGAAQMEAAGSFDAGRISQAADGYLAAISLLPVVAWHGLDRAVREEQLALRPALTLDAAACLIMDQRPEAAVEVLEQGRSVMWNQALQLRDDLSVLADAAPELAARLDDIRAALGSTADITALPRQRLRSSGAHDTNFGRSLHGAADPRRRRAREWDETLASVRAMRGFEHFMGVVPYQELTAAQAVGPVVIVNASNYDGYALIIGAGNQRARPVPLAGLRIDSALSQAGIMHTALSRMIQGSSTLLDYAADIEAVFGVLQWLWDVVTEPVLTELGHTATPAVGAWPRVWWCPTGPMAILPIHAAGYHSRHSSGPARDCDSVLDRVISSYTTTLSALARARQPGTPGPVRQLTVGVPDVPGMPLLPGVEAELGILARHFPASQDNRFLAGQQATRASVLGALPGYAWIHIACHALQDQTRPYDSGFILSDGTLTIGDLAAQPGHHRELAFLSACQTATGSFNHFDEAIHLAAAMQLLGYRHIIATSWTIADQPAARVAAVVYEVLTSGGTPDAGLSAAAVHKAVRQLRERNPHNPMRWAPYIHFGP